MIVPTHNASCEVMGSHQQSNFICNQNNKQLFQLTGCGRDYLWTNFQGRRLVLGQEEFQRSMLQKS